MLIFSILSAINWESDVDIGSVANIAFWIIIAWIIIVFLLLKFISHEKDKEDRQIELDEADEEAFNNIWPMSQIILKTKRLYLRSATDLELSKLAHNSVGQLLEEGQQDWLDDWAIQPSPEYQLSMLQHNWSWKADWQVDDWKMEMGIFFKNEIVGLISIEGIDFKNNKQLRTGIWLLNQARGQGIASEAKAALLKFGFEYLQAEKFVVEVYKTNSKSLKVNQNLNYKIVKDEDKVSLELKREHWEDKLQVTVGGFEKAKHFFLANEK